MKTAAQVAAVLLAVKAMVLATALAMGWPPTKLPDLPTLLFLVALWAVQLTLAVAVLMAFDRYFNAIVDRVRRAWRTWACGGPLSATTQARGLADGATGR